MIFPRKKEVFDDFGSWHPFTNFFGFERVEPMRLVVMKNGNIIENRGKIGD